MYFLEKFTEPLPRGQEAIFEVTEAKFWISSIFNEFSFRIFIVLSFEVVWPRWPQCLQKGPREFFQKLHFRNQCVPTKKMRYVTALSKKFSLNLSTEEVWALSTAKNHKFIWRYLENQFQMRVWRDTKCYWSYLNFELKSWRGSYLMNKWKKLDKSWLRFLQLSFFLLVLDSSMTFWIILLKTEFMTMILIGYLYNHLPEPSIFFYGQYYALEFSLKVISWCYLGFVFGYQHSWWVFISILSANC